LKFLFSFENEYGSNWNYYDIINEKVKIIQELEKENSQLKEKVEELTLKLKTLRKRKMSSKKK
jgi:hypothetical protein